MKPAAKRDLVSYARKAYKISARRACGLFGLWESSLYYKSKGRDDGPLRAALNKCATENQGWGYRGLMDFLSDQLADGRVIRVLVIMDVYSRECLALEVDTSITGRRVTRVLDRLAEERGLPRVLGTDNGPEFRSRHMDLWACNHGVKLHFIKPGKLTQNATIESLNSQIRKRLLDTNWFNSLAEVRFRAEDWKTIYNTVQRHGSLNKTTPEDFAAQARLRSATPTSAGPGQNHNNQPDGRTLAVLQ